MSTIKNHLPVLVLSKHVYARRKDGRFYAGSIEDKQDDVYTVKFAADGSRELVLEENLTWLGCWDLPEMHRPKRPVVWGTVFTSNEFDGKISECSSGSKTQNPESFTLLKSFGDRDNVELCEPGKFSQSSMRGQPHCAGQSDVAVHSQSQPSVPEQQNVIQERSSVLRINRQALSRELSTNNIDTSLSSSRKKPANTDLHPTLSNRSVAKYIKDKSSNFDFMSAYEPLRRRSYTRRDNEIIESSYGYETPGMSLWCHCESEDKRETGEAMKSHVQTGRHLSPYRERRYQSMDWYQPPPVNQSAFTSPITPSSSTSSLIEAELPRFSHPETETELIAGTCVESARKRKKDEAKKCRKVYGITNRQLWCTQCKWKKACSRFKE